jgi:hypothetical protein
MSSMIIIDKVITTTQCDNNIGYCMDINTEQCSGILKIGNFKDFIIFLFLVLTCY